MNITKILARATMFSVSALSLNSLTMAQVERTNVEEKYKWDLTPIYKTVDDWRQEKETLANSLPSIREYKGRLAESAQTLYSFFHQQSENERIIAKLYLYASLLSDQDVSVADNLALVKEVEQVDIEFAQITDFTSSELAAIPEATYAKFRDEEPRLDDYRMVIDRVLRERKHTLSEAEEAVLAKMSILGNAPNDAYSVFSDAEMPAPSITLSDGSAVLLDHANFAKIRSSKNRDDRKAAYEAFWDNYKKYEGTFGELMNGNIRRSIFGATVRKYPSSLDAALYGNNIPTDVYQSLIENVNKNLPTFHRYLKLKARLLGYDKLEYYDLYAPAVADVDLNFTLEEAQQMVLDAVKPLGDDYSAVVKRAFEERWIDFLPNKGKRSGAYSNGAAYDVHPYILMNFDGRYDNVGTLIHELGHTMQSYYSNLRQPYPLADYSIFVAEVASTFNEALLDHLMLSRLTDKAERISLLMSMLDGFKGTLFRQTQFAEFQLEATKMAERGEPITGQALSELYGRITRKYYGHDAGVCNVDERINIEWAFIPHFYMGFYVYQYSTSFVASQALSQNVLYGKPDNLSRYLDFLACGDSKYPIEQLSDAGVDMLSPVPFDTAIAKMNAIMDEIEKLL